MFATETGGRANSPDYTGLLVPADDRVLLYLGTIEPRLHARLGDIASVDAYYRLKSANSSDEGSTAGQPHSYSTDSLNQTFELAVTSGTAFNAVTGSISANHAVGTGTGINNQSTSDHDVLLVQYHFNHTFSAQGTVGYEKIHYNASIAAGAFTTEGLIWSLGGSVTPNPTSLISVTYGYQQGGYSPTVQIAYALGARTKLNGSYNVNVQNQLQSTLANLQYLTFDQNGNPIDKRTGLPFFATNSIFGEQNVLTRDALGVLAISHEFYRGGATLSGNYESRSSVTGFTTRDTAIGVALQFARDLTPQLSCTLDLGYTDHRSSGAILSGPEHARLTNVGFSFFYHINPTTSFVANGTYVHKRSNLPNANFTTEQIVIGLNKDF
jgi:hypothetical protein